MNPALNFLKIAAYPVLFLLILVVSDGCGDPSQPPPKLGVKNWRPLSIGGPLEVRPLPPASRVEAEWKDWIASDTTAKARVYETVLMEASNQVSFNVEVSRGETPLGRPEHTYVRFLYKDATNGLYEFLWHRLGRHSGDFLKLDNRPKTVWVQFNHVAERSGIPLLQIEAFEGLEPNNVITAERGRRPE